MSPDKILTPPPRTTWFPKFGVSLFACVAVFNIAFTAIGVLGRVFIVKIQLLILLLYLGQLVLSIPFGFGAAYFWHAAEKKGRIDSLKWYAVGQAILRCWLAFELSLYGFAKILGTQFTHALSLNDVTVSRLSGLELTWNYFGYSYVFAVIIALVQIGGSILLLFRRTTLLGAVILLPVLVNIFLIDLFYHIPVLGNAMLFTLGLIFLLYLRRKDLIEVFLRWMPALPEIGRGWMRWGLRLLAIGGAFGIIYTISIHTHSVLEGKWHIEAFRRKGHLYRGDEWLTDSGSWTTLYLNQGGRIVLCPNPYIYDRERSYEGSYQYDTVGRRMRALFDKGKDSLVATVGGYDGGHMEWRGRIGGDSIYMQLSRVGQ